MIGTLNVGAKTDDPRGVRLSNFSADAFVLDGQRFASVEGFIQGIKWPEGHEKRAAAFAAVGGKAKRSGEDAERKSVWWGGEEIPYGAPFHHMIMELAIRAKFGQNPEAMQMLRATEGLTLIHDLGKPEDPRTSLPAAIFCDILTRIRDKK